MAKISWKAGNMLYPLPVVMVSCAREGEKPNIITAAWAGTVCTQPAMLSVSIRPERYSHAMIAETGEFVVNLTTTRLVKAVDFCGVRSGRDLDKFKEAGLTPGRASVIQAPTIEECPVNIECKLEKIIPLGSHDLFLARVVAVDVDDRYMDEKGRFDLNKAGLLVYSHGEYYGLGDMLGTFGYSVRKPVKGKEKGKEKQAAIKKVVKNEGKMKGETGKTGLSKVINRKKTDKKTIKNTGKHINKPNNR